MGATRSRNSDIARLPILDKAEFRGIRPGDLLPQIRRLPPHIGRWTSGTSGRATVNFWTATDWSALVASTARMMARQAPMPHPVAFSGYSHSHLTGALYHDALTRLGGTVFDRSHHAEETFSTPAHMELFDFDTLVLPERTKPGKGVGLADLLDEDPGLLERHRVRWWMGSSKTFDPEVVAAARAQGIESISNFYGASEFGIFAISCTVNAGDYHVAQGHVLVEVVDAHGVRVASGQPGRVVVTHLSGLDDDGNSEVHTGTQILRLAGGDGATFVGDVCTCGLTAPRLRDVHRIGRDS